MIEELRKYIRNRNAKAKAPSCEQILGDTYGVNRFAHFYRENAADLELVVACKIHQWQTSNVFSDNELKAFLAGVACIGTFFKDCAIEDQMNSQNSLPA